VSDGGYFIYETFFIFVLLIIRQLAEANPYFFGVKKVCKKPLG